MKQSSVDRLYGIALDALDDGILIAAPDGTIGFMNSRMKALLAPAGKAGSANAAGPVASMIELLKESDSAGPVRGVLGGTSVTLSGRILRKEGDGGALCLVIARSSDEGAQLQEILDTFADGYCEIDADGIFTHVNRSFCSFLGYGEDDLVGKSFKMLVDSELTGNIMGAIRAMQQEEFRSRMFNWELVRRDGKKCSVEVSLSLIRDTTGSPGVYRGLLRDTTERKRMEEELVLARKIEAIGIMAGGIAHDYNNALTAVLGNLSLAKMEADPEKKELHEVLNDAEAAALRVLELTKRLSSFARGGKPRLVAVSTEMLKDIIRDTLDSVMKGFPGKCDIAVDGGLRQVEVDTAQFSHVIEHIANNAKEAMPNGGTITVTAGNITVEKEKIFNEISLYPDDYVILSIKDRGEGIRSDIIDRIFDPYFTTKEIATGMGLTICYAIMKRHHGFIEVQTEEGEGTIVNVYLPVVKQ